MLACVTLGAQLIMLLIAAAISLIVRYGVQLL